MIREKSVAAPDPVALETPLGDRSDVSSRAFFLC